MAPNLKIPELALKFQVICWDMYLSDKFTITMAAFRKCPKFQYSPTPRVYNIRKCRIAHVITLTLQPIFRCNEQNWMLNET
jgi:hypothetical protein